MTFMELLKKRPREIKSLCCQSPKWRLFVGLRETTIRPATTTPTACRTKVPEISHRRRDDEWFFFFFFWWWWWRLGPWPGVVLFYVYKTLSAGVELHKAVTCLDKSWRIRNESELRRRRHQKKKRKERNSMGSVRSLRIYSRRVRGLSVPASCSCTLITGFSPSQRLTIGSRSGSLHPTVGFFIQCLTR